MAIGGGQNRQTSTLALKRLRRIATSGRVGSGLGRRTVSLVGSARGLAKAGQWAGTNMFEVRADRKVYPTSGARRNVPIFYAGRRKER